jgi:Glycoside hydrolase 123, catalytic domain/Glycoside hydrolase 123 N-terminal domain/Carbohydrate family 9 binding domain-like
MNRALLFTALATCLLWAHKAQSTEQLPPTGPVPARPALCIAPAQSPPRIDGLLDDACWRAAVATRQFNLSYQARFAPYETEAKLAYDRDGLYVALRVTDAEPGGNASLPYPPDRDPSVAEVLIATGKEEHYYKVAVNSKGEVRVTQPMGNAAEWLEPVTAVMVRGTNAWTAEFAIPFAAVDLPSPHTQDGRASDTPPSWRVNMGWRTPKCTEYSAWAVTHAWFYEPQYYGDLYFGGPDALTAELVEVRAPGPGQNLLPLRMVNRDAAPVPCEVTVTLEDEHETRTPCRESVSVPAGSQMEFAPSYGLLDGMTGVATLEVRRKGSTSPFLRQSIPVCVPANRTAFRAAQAALAAFESRGHGPRWQAKEERTVRSGLRDLGKDVFAADASLEDWEACQNPLERLLGRANKLLWSSDHADELGKAAFALGATHTLGKVLRDRAHTAPPARVVSVSAARGEYEGVQLLVIPLGQGLNGLDVSPAPLSGPEGATIPADAIEVRWTDFVQTRTPRYPIEFVGWIADPLLPLDASPRSIPADALHQPLWVTVHVPHGIPAGVYTGTLRVSADGVEPQAVQLRVRVRDFDLPVRPALQTSMWLNPANIKDWYGWDEIPKDVLRREMDFLLEHRVNPTWFGPIGDDDDIEYQLERGLNLVMLGVADEWPLPEEKEAEITRLYDFFKERDLLDLCFIYGQDEPSPWHYAEVRDTLTKVAERYPGVRRVCTAYPPVPTLEGAVDTWVVGPNLFNYGPVAERVAAGDELWFYHSASVRRPYAAQFYLDYTALENRLVSWYCWKYGATGFLYWGINEWRSNNQPWSGDPEIDDAIRAGRRWPKVPWNTWTYLNCNGDAQYIYPGPDGEFWSSVRMEIIRDAFEDYDYFALLDAARERLDALEIPGTQALLADAEELLDLGPPLLADLTSATRESLVLLKRRDAVARHLERILSVLNAE